VTEIPTSLNAVSAAWLRDALVAQGTECPTIEALAYEPMPGIVGALGEIGIFTIDWAGPTGLPTKMVGKCPLDDDMARMFNAVMQHYRRENGFYADVAPKVDMVLPTCHLNLADPETDQNLLMIEFFGDAEDGDILGNGISVDQMLRLTEDLARMHGTFWLYDTVGDLPWLLDWRTESFELGIPITTDAWATFNAAEPGFFDPTLRAALDNSWIKDMPRLLGAMADRPWTFTHGDYELDNFLFRNDGSVVILDWQTAMKSFPGVDLGWFLACSHSPETLAEEPAILDHYRKVLAASGGPTWSCDELIEDLAWGMFYHAVGQTVTNTMDYEGRAKARFRRMLEGCHDAALRWNLAEVAANA